MNLDRLYRGLTKDGKKRLLYKMIDVRNKFVMYKDLETNEKFTSYTVLEDELVPFTNMNKGNKKKVIKQYKIDNNSMFNTDNLYIGDLCIVEWKYSCYINQNFPQNSKPMDVKPIEYNVVFVKLSDDEYKDFLTKKVFKVAGNSELYEGALCVNNLRKCTKVLELPEEELVSKDLVLRKSYKKFKGIK